MRKTKTIKIDGEEITVKELRVKDLRKILDTASDFSGIEQVLDMLPMATDLAQEKIEDMAPSELGRVWDAFKEVNAFFLDLVEKSGMVKVMKSSIQKCLTDAFAGLSDPATPAPPNTE